jgi:hypothetical protein
MPMNEIYTFLQHDALLTTDEMLAILNRISELNLFDSSGFHKILDEFKVNASDELINRVKSFNQSSFNIDIKIREIRELMLN